MSPSTCMIQLPRPSVFWAPIPSCYWIYTRVRERIKAGVGLLPHSVALSLQDVIVGRRASFLSWTFTPTQLNIRLIGRPSNVAASKENNVTQMWRNYHKLAVAIGRIWKAITAPPHSYIVKSIGNGTTGGSVNDTRATRAAELAARPPDVNASAML